MVGICAVIVAGLLIIPVACLVYVLKTKNVSIIIGMFVMIYASFGCGVFLASKFWRFQQGYVLSDTTAQSFDIFMGQWKFLHDSALKDDEIKYLEEAYSNRNDLYLGPEKNGNASDFYQKWFDRLGEARR